MPGLRLECSVEGDRERLLAVGIRSIIFEHLADATVFALKIAEGHRGVSLKFVYAPGINVPRIEVVADVSKDKTPPPQDMEEWLDALKHAWRQMRLDVRLLPVSDIIEPVAGFWPSKKLDGIYGET